MKIVITSFGDKTGNQKYLAGKTSEVLLLGNSGETVSSSYMDVDEEKTNGSSLGSINSLAIAQTNLVLIFNIYFISFK